MNKAKEYRDQTVEELTATLLDDRRAIFDLRNERRMNAKVENRHVLREKRRNVARLLTVLREKTGARS